MQQRIVEIESYLQHEDYSLAVRRMLDSCLDAADPTLLEDSIQWSNQFRDWEKTKTATTPPEDFFSTATALLGMLEKRLPGTATKPVTLLEATSIGKSYTSGSFTLQPMSVAMNTGAILGVVGENGNGKTTLLRCLAGQLALDTGTLVFNQLHQPDHYAIKHHVAFIPQRIPRWYGKLRDNLHFSASLSGITGAENIRMVNFMLQRFNLNSFAELNWTQISSGYRTRFELARILLQKPSLLILDEPLANLDINAQQTILTDLRYLAKSLHHPMGVILSSQQLHEVEKVADEVMLIKNGSCLHRKGSQEVHPTTTTPPPSFALEFETKAERKQLLELFEGMEVQLHYNGGFYTAISTTHDPRQIVKLLLDSNLPVSYFRDITYSTKRYFQ